MYSGGSSDPRAKAASHRHYLRKKTDYARRRDEHRARRRDWLDEQKSESCLDCGVAFPPCVMDFDHREGEEKLFNIGASGGIALAVVKKEIAKCDLVCANCHRIRTYGPVAKWEGGGLQPR